MRSPSCPRTSTRPARGCWSHGFRSCAAWLTLRVGLEPGAARGDVPVARAPCSLPRPGQALAAARETLYRRARTTRVEDVPAGTSFANSCAEAPTVEQQQADALALVAETALHHGIDPGAPGERYQVVVHVDAEVLADADTP